MPRFLLALPLLAAPFFPSSAPAASAAPASTAKITYLDDEAEAGGFDVTAKVNALPIAWTLIETEEKASYRLAMSSIGATLSLRGKGGDKVLARAAMALKPGFLVVQRRGGMWRALLNGRMVLEAHDSALSEGRIGYVGAAVEARVQPVEEINFDDDFMRVKEDVALASAKDDPKRGIRIADVKDAEAIWKPAAGNWATTGLSENAEAQVAQSVNAFVFKTTSKGESMALAGRPFWSDYTLEASVRPEGASAVGLAFYAQDAKNYLLMKWQARQNMDESSGRVLLQSVVDGKVSTLAQSAGGFEDKQWYRLKVEVVGDLMRALVDDVEVARARSTLFGRGHAGLWAQNVDEKTTALFDDVRVRSDRDIEDDFSRVVPGRWTVDSGSWSWRGAAQSTSTSPARALTGEADWSDYSLAAPLALPSDASAGLVLHASEEGSYLLRVGGSRSRGGFAGRTQIIKIAGGKTQVLASSTTGARMDGRAVTLGFSIDDGYLAASVDGVRVADAFDESLQSGRAGLWSARAGSAPTFGAFAVRFPDVRPTWAKVPDLYEEERQAETMGGWSTPSGFWLPAKPTASTVAITPAPGAPKTLWHKGTFWGDGRLKFKVPELKAGESFAILLDAPSASNKAPLIVSFTQKDGALQASASREGQSKPLGSGKSKIEGKATDYTVDIRQRGSFVIVRAMKSEEERATLFAARVK